MDSSTVVDSTPVELMAGFAALADPVRLRLIGVLAGGGRCVCDLQKQVPVAPNLLSYHLRVLGQPAEAVAICDGCGAALCCEHAHVTPRWLTATMAINRVVAVEPPARTIRCTVCQAARDAAPDVSYAPAGRA